MCSRVGMASLGEMRTQRALLGLFLSAGTAALFLQCVGDSVVATPGNDAGADTSTADGGTADGGDASPAEAGPPAPDGSLAWVQHFNSNVGMSQVAVRESPNLSFVVVGGYRNTSSGNDFMTHVGSFDLPHGGDATLPLIMGLDPQGNPTWTNVPTSTPSGNGNGGDVFLSSVATDAAGDIYLAGTSSRASVTFAQSHVGTLAFVTKLSADGKTFLWDHVFTSTDYAGSPRLAVSGKHVVATFGYSKILTYDASKTFASVGSYDVAALSLDNATGATRWAATFGGAGGDGANDAAIDANGDVYIAGQGSGTLSGTGAGFPLVTSGANSYDALLVKLAFADGKSLFTKSWGAGGTQQTDALGVDVHGTSVAVAGQFTGGNDFGKGVVGTAGGTDGFVLVLDATTMATTFVATAAGTGFDGFQSVGFDRWGQVLATGQYDSIDAKIGAKALKASTYRAAGFMAAKWDASGALVWANSVVPTLANGNPPYSAPDAVAPYLAVYPGAIRVTQGGYLVNTGAMTGGVNFGDGVYRPRLSTMTAEGTQLCFNPPCAPNLAPDSLVSAWAP